MGIRAAIVLACLPLVIGLILRSPVLGVVTFIATDFVRPQDLTWGFEEVRFALVVALATLVGYLAKRGKFRPVPTPRAEPFLVALMIAMLASSATAAESALVSLDWNVRFVKVVIFCGLLARIVDSRERLEMTLRWLLFGIGLLAAWAFLQHFQGNERLEGVGNGGDQNSSNYLGAILCLALPIAVAFRANARRGSWERLAALGLVPVLLADIVFTQSRAAYIATAALAGFALLVRRIRGKVLVWLVVAGIVGGAVGVSKFERRAETIATQGLAGSRSEDGSIAMRIVLWEHALDFFARSPVTGVGQQNSALLIKKETQIGKAKSIHNTYLQLLADGGASCLLLWALAFAAGFRDARAAARAALVRRDAQLWRTAVGIQLALAAFLAASVFHSFDYLELPYWLVTLAGVTRGLALRADPLTLTNSAGRQEAQEVQERS